MTFRSFLRGATALALFMGLAGYAAADERNFRYSGSDTEVVPHDPIPESPGTIPGTDITFKYFGSLPSAFHPHITTRDDISPNLAEPAGSFDADDTYPGVVTVEMFDPISGDDFICTGTLINSRTILTAGHCVAGLDPGFANDSDFQAHIYFGPDTLDDYFDFNSLPGTSHFAHSGFDPDAFYLGNDIALISLSAPVYDVPYVVLAASAPSVGDSLTLVGYGQAGIGSNPGTVFDLKRRVATNLVEYVGFIDDLFLLGPGEFGQSNLIFTDFEDPTDPVNTDLFGTPVATAREGSSDHGDSGGPIFNGLGQQVGVTSGGVQFGPNAGGYADLAFWTSVADFNGWIGANNPLRFALDNLGSGSWTDPGQWVFGVVPDNDTHFDDDSFAITDYTIARHYYEVELSGAGITTLSSAVEIDKLDMAFAGTELNITGTGGLDVWSDVGVFFNSTLRVNGDLRVLLSDDFSVFLATNGRLMGSGNVIADVANFGGRVAPGNSIGTLTIAGSYAENASGNLDIEVSNSGADHLHVGGSALLAGALNLTDFGPAPTSGQIYNILDTEGFVFGTFGTVNDLSAGPAAHLIYGDTFVSVLFGTPTFDSIADGPIEVPVGEALEDIFANGDLEDEILQLLAMDEDQLHQALQSLNPTRVNAQGIAAISVGDLLRNQFVKRSHDLLGDNGSGAGMALFNAPGAQLANAGGPDSGMMAAAAAAAIAAMDGQAQQGMILPNGYAVYGSADIALTQTTQPGLLGSDDGEFKAITGGIEHSDGEGFLYGVAASYLDGKVDQDYGLGGATKMDGFALSIYGDWRMSMGYFDAFASYGMLNFDTNRLLLTAPFTTTQVVGSTESSQFQAGGTLGLDVLNTQGIRLGAVGGLYYIGVDIDGYTETGSVFGAVVPDRTIESLKGAIGGEMSFDIVEDRSVTPFVRVLLNHEFMDDAFATSVAFAGAPNVSFTAPGPQLSDTWTTFGAGLSGEIFGARVYGRYEGNINRSGQVENTFSAAARVPF